MTQTTQCGFCRETYEISDQTYTPDALAAPINQCAACARQAARGCPKRDYPMFDRPTAEHTVSDGRCVERWRPDDRVELVAWQPSDLVWLASDASASAGPA